MTDAPLPENMPPALPRRAAIGALSSAALGLFVGAAPAAPRWSATVEESGIGAYAIGNPQAKVKLVEYFSYTCPHCADFAKAAAGPIKSLYIDKGLLLFEYRNLVRDSVDMVAALLARCGGRGAFAGNHQALFAAQPAWLDKAQKLEEAKATAKWYAGSNDERSRHIAADTGLAALMRARGYSAAAIDASLTSEVAAAEIMAMTNVGQNADRVHSTPTFFINGRRTDTNIWPALKSRLDAAIKAA